jgi:hypothetical protein
MEEKLKEGKKEKNSKQEQGKSVSVRHSRDLELTYFSTSRGEPVHVTTSNYCSR